MTYLKKPVLLLAMCTIGFTATNCYGPFKLSHKLYKWNGTVGDKYINALIFVGLNIVPVYTIAIGVDAIILNSIEFWTGNNPIAMNEGEKETKLITEAGKIFQVVTSKNQYEITQVSGEKTGETTLFVFNPNTNVWSLKSGSTSIDLVKVIDNGTEFIVEAYTPTSTTYFNLDGSKIENYSLAK